MAELSTLGNIIKAAYEAQANTNAFTDAEKTKLASLISEADALFLAKSDRASANGVASLDATGKVPMTQLNVSGLQFKGAWNPTTNVPALIDGTGSVGDFYKAAVAGSRNTGNGSFTYAVGDWIIFAAGIWQRLGSTDAVSMVNGKMGAVTLTAADVGALPLSYVPPVQNKTWEDISGKPALFTAEQAGLLYQSKRRGIIGHALPAVFASLPAHTSVAASTEFKLPFTTIRHDQFGMHDGAGGFTVPAWAKYARGTARLQWAANETGERQVRMSVNGASAVGANMTRTKAVDISMTIDLQTAIIPVTAGQVLSLTTWQNAGAAVQVQSTGSTWFNIELYE